MVVIADKGWTRSRASRLITVSRTQREVKGSYQHYSARLWRMVLQCSQLERKAALKQKISTSFKYLTVNKDNFVLRNSRLFAGSQNNDANKW